MLYRVLVHGPNLNVWRDRTPDLCRLQCLQQPQPGRGAWMHMCSVKAFRAHQLATQRARGVQAHVPMPLIEIHRNFVAHVRIRALPAQGLGAVNKGYVRCE